MTKNPIIYEKATFGGGCFWCLETLFNELNGVESVISGYAGGHTSNPTYELVCEGNTGHAEVIQITFDPKIISFKKLLEIFFSIHDPTTLNQQDNDIGTQYRSIILYENDEQQETAQHSIVEAAYLYPDPIITEVVQLQEFYPAEKYHQNYYENNMNQPYCSYNIAPKIQKFRQKYASLLLRDH